MKADYDILIVGGGLIGNCLAKALQDTPLKVAVVEAQDHSIRKKSPTGDRALALAAGTVQLLQSIDAWQNIHRRATAIKHIHISDQGHFGKTRLSADTEKVEALGYVIGARIIETQLSKLVGKTSAKQICPARVVGLAADSDFAHISIKAGEDATSASVKLVVVADGGASSVRDLLQIPAQTTEYGQSAIITTVSCSLDHQNTAFERFTAQGPLAILPIGNKLCSLVWTRKTSTAKQLMEDSDEIFLAKLQKCFGYTLGQLQLVAPRRAFPISLIRAQQMTATRAVLIGNAAQQLHPVAGQGFNLGIRDAIQLATMIKQQLGKNGNIGSDEFLRDVAAARRRDHDLTVRFTDGLVKIFSNDFLPISASRSIGLAVLDHIPPAKSALAKYAMGLVRQ